MVHEQRGDAALRCATREPVTPDLAVVPTLALVLALALTQVLALALTLVVAERSQAAERPIRLVAYGDDESIGGRVLPLLGTMPPNPFLPKLIEHLWQQGDDIDVILHAGDFVRFEPPPSHYRDLLRRNDPGRLWRKFFPTSGGDEEYCQGRFATFFELADHLQALPHQRDTCIGADGEPHSGYYYLLERRIRGQRLAVVVLHNPDQYGATERRRQCGAAASCDPLSHRNAQLQWIEATLREVRARDRAGDRAFLILLSHRPIYGPTASTNLVLPLLRRYRVNLTIAGDRHAYARKLLDGTLHVITGMAGSLVIGGCHTRFLSAYDRCLPPAPLKYVMGFGAPEQRYDHYLDVRIYADHFTIAPTRLDGSLLEGPLRLAR